MISNLYKQCTDFEKLTSSSNNVVESVSLVKNDDPILKQLSDIKNFDDRVEFAKKHFEFLGEGSSRTVFKINDDLIIKVAHNDKGISQNKVEMELDLQTNCAATVVVADPDGKWLISHFTETMTKEDFFKIVGVGFDAFMNSLFYAYNNESDNWSEPREYDKIRKLPLFECLGKMIVAANLLIGDCDKISSWGVKNNKVYLRDFGFDKATHERFYKNKSYTNSEPKSSS